MENAPEEKKDSRRKIESTLVEIGEYKIPIPKQNKSIYNRNTTFR